jgi:hypothetical protein
MFRTNGLTADQDRRINNLIGRVTDVLEEGLAEIFDEIMTEVRDAAFTEGENLGYENGYNEGLTSHEE